MATEAQPTFIIDCHICKAKVAAEGEYLETRYCDDTGEPYGNRIFVGKCPQCKIILVGASDQIGFKDWDAREDQWNNIRRVFPHPRKSFSSERIPRIVIVSLNEADRCIQAGANIAACAMLGRTLEALCRDVLELRSSESETSSTRRKKKLMLNEGITKLRDAKIIDGRLYDWSQQLRALRNLATHPEDITISRQDTEDLQTFVNAIVEYVYDLADRYEEFKARAENRTRQKSPSR